MLASLDEVPGVAASRVDWTGRQFLLELAPGARTGNVVEAADEVLGGDTWRLDRPVEVQAIAGFRRGEKWLRADDTLELSRAEARILAARFGDEAARAAGLDADQSRRLIALLEEQIAAGFDRVHAARDPAEIAREQIAAIEAVLEKSRAFVRGDQTARLEEYFRSHDE